MRSQFAGYFNEPKEEVDRFWKEATFVFDANVLLNLYRYSDKAREEFLDLLTKIQDRSWLPEQCVHEYLSNRLSVTREQMLSYTATEKKMKEIEEKFAGSKGHPFISEKNFHELKNILKKINTELSRNSKEQERHLTKDRIQDQLADIFDGKVGNSFSNEDLEKLFSEGEGRYHEEMPPGYKDGKKHQDPKKHKEKRSNYGDFILWRQTMDWAKEESKDVVFVTDDQKEDWWLIISGKTIGARPELKTEFKNETRMNILFYNPDSFLQLAREKLGIKVSEDTISEIRQEHESRSLATAKRRKSALELNHRHPNNALWFSAHDNSSSKTSFRGNNKDQINLLGSEIYENEISHGSLIQTLARNIRTIKAEREKFEILHKRAVIKGDELRIQKILLKIDELVLQEEELNFEIYQALASRPD